MRRTVVGLAVVFAFAISGAYILYSWWFPTYVYRYRLSIIIDTPDGPKFGQTVTEVSSIFGAKFNGVEMVSRVHGEAMYIDLGHNKNVVVLLAGGLFGENTDYPWRLPRSLFQLDGSRTSLKKLPRLNERRSLFQCPAADHSRELHSCLPTFVTFRNPEDYKTVEFADSSHLDQKFGAGFVLRDAFIETTGDSVSYQLKRYLPWLPIDSYFNGQHACGQGDTYHCLHGGHFMRNY